MNKLIYTEDLPDELLTALEGHTSTFFDSNQMCKSASSSAFSKAMMEQHLPDDKHFAVHYIALGAHEHYGPNRNGDAWPEAGLEHDKGNYGTHTFVKNGHYFREHRNRDPKQKIGDIKAAAYNKAMHRSEVIVWGDKRKAEQEYEAAKAGKALDMSMSARVPGDRCSICDNFAKSSKVYCFVPSTLITMADGTVKPIKDIQTDDVVLSATGKPTKVIGLFQRDVHEPICKIKTSLSSEYTQVTGNHPFLSVGRENGNCYYSGLKSAQRIPQCWPGTLPECKDCRKLFPDPSFVAAGDLRKNDYVLAPIIIKDVSMWDNFCDEQDAWVYGLFTAEGSYAKAESATRGYAKRGLQFSIHEAETELIARLRDYFQTKYNLQTYVYPHAGSKGVSVRVHSFEVAEIFYKVCGEYAQSKTIDARFLHAPAEIQVAFLNGLYDGDGHLYNMRAASKKMYSRLNSASLNLIWQTWQLLAQQGSKNYTGWQIQCGGPTQRTNKSNVWYLSSSFMGDADVMRNVRWNNGTHMYGYVLEHTFEDFSGTVHNFETCDGTYVANGLAVHNCDHLKHHMTQWMPKKAKFAFAFNDHPNFFDASAVAHKADRIASHLEVRLPEQEKSASYGGFTFSDERATAEGVLLPDNIELGCSVPAHQRWLEKLCKVASTLTPNTAAFCKEASAYAFSDSATEAQVTAMRELTPDVLFAWMAKRAATIPFDAFVAYVSNKNLSDVRADASFKQAAARLPELFKFTSEAVANPESENLVTPASAIKLASFGPDYSTEKELKELAKNNTLVLADARQRMYQNCVQSKAASYNVPTIQSDLSTQARNWLQAYGLYKVAAISNIADNIGQDYVDDSTLLLVISQAHSS